MTERFNPTPHLIGISRDSDILGDRSSVLRLDRNERPGAFTPGELTDMLKGVTSELFTAYPDYGPLYRRLGDATGLAEDHLSLGAGSDAIIRRAFQAFLQPGDTVVSADPSYGMYPVWARIFQANLRPVPYDDDLTLDLGAFLGAVSAGARIVAIANPDQPTGALRSLKDLRQIAAAARGVGALCLIDEAYFPFCPESALPLVHEFDNVLLTRTFSKAYGIAGLRVGFGCAQPSVTRALHTVRSPGEVASLSIHVACHLLDHPEIAESFRAAAEAGRNYLIEEMRALGYDAPPCNGNFQIFRVGDDDPKAIEAYLKERGILIKAGFSSPCLKDCIRITLDAPGILAPAVAALRERAGQ
jgi:histidinol-phosphate aminotransferase